MAIFHLDFKILKRSEGKSSLYLSAYNSRERLTDEKTGLVFNYEKKKEDLIYKDILLPTNAPERFKNRSYLWNEVEESEKRKDAQLSRYAIIALPRELTVEQNKKLLVDFLNKNFIKKGMCVDFAIHNDKDNNNPHAHIMLTMREIEGGKFSAKKNRDWNKKENVELWRRSWAVYVNKALRENNKSDFISSLSFLKQREILIEKAKENLNNNKLDEAEKYIDAYNVLRKKKPKKRKPRQNYMKRKNIKKNINIDLINHTKKQKEKEFKKDNLLNSFFKNIVNKITHKTRQKRELEERRQREIEALKQWQKNEDLRAEEKQKNKQSKTITEVKNERKNNNDNKRRVNTKPAKAFKL